MSERRPTLQDVASASGVSRATASFVLNETAGQTISAATRERVRAAAAELGYVPHAFGRALREGTSRTVLLELDGLDAGHALRGFVAGMEAELAGAGIALLVRPSAGPSPDRAVVDVLRPRAVVRLGRTYGDDAEPDDGGWADGLAAHTLVQVEHLAAAGHRALAVAVPEAGGRIVDLRLRFLRESVDRLGLDPVEMLPVPADRPGVVAAVRRLLAAAPAVSAVAGFDDATALRVLAALADLGVGVPAPVAVMGFDDGDVGEFAIPALTSVRIDAEAYGRRAARRVLGGTEADIVPQPAVVVRRDSA